MIACVSCIFGNRFKYVYPAPIPSHSYFFSNNKDIEKNISTMGWIFIYISPDINYENKDIKSSLQSKYVKFLQFLENLEIFRNYSYLLYTDHKRYIKNHHIDDYLHLYKYHRLPIILSLHERENRDLKSEIQDSLIQDRYKKI